MHSFEMLVRITGKPLWADRCEEIAFNSFPAAMTPDQKALHYLTCANQVQLDRENKSPGVQNGGTMFSYSPFEVYRCCQHNVSHGWPYYAEELWLATPDNGLCASLYASSRVRAKAGAGAVVTIAEETGYPFGSRVNFRIDSSRPASFPLYLRVPRWCSNAAVSVNGRAAGAKPAPLSFIRISRLWRGGDQVVLELPMSVSVRSWPNNQNAVSVNYGPLSFSLAIKERFEKYGNRNPAWPEWEVFPDSPWNYGLVLDAEHPASSFEVALKTGPVAAQPFTPETAPIELKAKARRLPGWQLDSNHLVGKLPPSPAKSAQPIEDVTLIPMGAARLRVATFPVIGDGPAAREGVAEPNAKPAAQ
jgi:hypothetical protein